jgi:TetR/AcrR family transcriptional regulator, copper-responsive repressor
VVQKRASPADRVVAAARKERPLYDAPKSPLLKRGRPRAYDPEDALKRARDVFWVKGYAGTTLDDIVEATGMNRPSLYAAFGDKEAIYLAALKMQGELLVGAVAGAVKLDLKLKPFLDLFFERCIESYLAGANGPRGCFLVGTALTESLMRDDVGAVVRDAFERVDALLEGRLRLAKKAGELGKGADPAALAQFVSSIMHELSMYARAGSKRAALEQRVAMARKLMGA